MDIAFEAVGSQGKFQRIIGFLVILVAALSLQMSSSFPFMTKKPDFNCKKKDSLENFHICPEKDLCKYDFFDYTKISESSLKNWAYEFDIFCSKSYISPLIGSTFFLGGIIGSIFLSPLPDKYGRKDIYKILLIALFALNLNVFFAINEWHVLLANILLGFVSYAYSMSSVIITEYIDRSTAGIIMSFNNAIFPFSGIIYAFFYMTVNSWRVLFFFSSLLALLCVGLSQKYFLESPRWLNSKNKFTETLDVLKEIAKINDSEENFNKFLSLNKSNLIIIRFKKKNIK